MARPRSFDIQEALAAAAQVFLRRGFDGASLEDLTAAMGINKPSLYAAYGDKGALYAKVLQGYAAAAKSAMESALNAGDTLEDAARHLLRGAIEVYAPAKGNHLGCLIATTATTVAGSDSAVRDALATFLVDVDQLIETSLKKRFCATLADHRVTAATEILSATMYALAIRARAGASRKRLLAIAARAAASVEVIARA
jgi:AcrR family transcriptional regulator